ncbi:hypothetical protein BLOT_009957 [Blomia tropicalis]|nr:hypothetical protein BLOT_009957 [Blomia tropicalis]
MEYVPNLTIILSMWIILLVHKPESINGQMPFACSPAYCAAYGKCPEFSCKAKNEIVLKNVTQCGCCHRCVTEKEEGEECPVEITGNLPANQCGPHLRCVRSGRYGICAKMDTDCERERQRYEQSSTQLIISNAKPECDQFGEYVPRRCKNGTICQCVNEMGEPIFGMAPYNEAKEMNCLCSRQFKLLNVKLMEAQSKPIDEINFMRCKSNGNYEPYQIHLHHAYCIHEKNGTMWDRPVVRSGTKDLPCFEDRYQFKTDCVNRYNQALANITKHEKEDYLVVGFDLPRCDLDGSYQPVQCQNDKCFCVSRDGKPYRGAKNERLEVDRYDPLAADQQCTCARHMETIRAIKSKYRNKITELFGRYQCDRNGNYLPIQCSDSACYCVDQLTGYSIQSSNVNDFSSALKTETESIKQLFCYKEYIAKTSIADHVRLNELLRIPNEKIE